MKQDWLSQNQRNCTNALNVYLVHGAQAVYTDKRFHSDDLHQCESCPSMFQVESLLRDHQKIKHEEGLICNHCWKTFKSRPGLAYHMKKVMENFQHKCTHCDKTFISRQHFDDHVNTHRNYKPFKCSKCKKAFTYNYLLKAPEEQCHQKEVKFNECEM